MTTQSVLGFDPLPPLDTIYSYVRPERYFLLCSWACTAPRSVLGLGGSRKRVSLCWPCVFTYLSTQGRFSVRFWSRWWIQWDMGIESRSKRNQNWCKNLEETAVSLGCQEHLVSRGSFSPCRAPGTSVQHSQRLGRRPRGPIVQAAPESCRRRPFFPFLMDFSTE